MNKYEVHQIKNLVLSNTKTVQEYLLLDGSTYKIPYAQRKYEWGKKQIQRLFDDVFSLYKSGDDNVHMLNVFTILSENRDLLIYDGQQRTITCLLLVAAIARKAKGIKNDLSEQLMEKYVHQTNAIDDKEQRKIVFDSDIDTNYFYRMIDTDMNVEDLKKERSKENKNSNKKAFINAYLLLIDNLNQYEWNSKSITDFTRTFFENCFLVELQINKRELAEKMFETLNNTGKDLEKYYVLKNDIIRQLGEDRVREKWNIIDSNLENVSYNKFLRSFAQVIYGRTRAEKTLDNIYKKYNRDNKNEMENLLEKLHIASNRFFEIIYPNDLISNSGDIIEFQELSHYFKAFSFNQHYSIILSMLLKDYSFKDINLVLKAILVLYIRNFYFGMEKTNAVEDPFANFAKKIYYDETNIEDVIRNVYSWAKDDELVMHSIKGKDNSKSPAVKALLTIMYNNDFKELKISSQNVDLEHILPQNPKERGTWDTTFDDEKHTEYVNKLGNLTLWYNKDNRHAKNSEFVEKREDYKFSKLDENNEIADNDKWTEEDIDQRTNKMAKDIVNIFKIQY